MDDEQLIECVRRHPAIYDLSHSRYLDNNFKISLWKMIGKEMQERDISCKKRWINIRDQFKKSLNRRKLKSEQITDNKVFKKYKYEEMLQFLMPYIHERAAIINRSSGPKRFESIEVNNIDIFDEVPRKKKKKEEFDSVSNTSTNYVTENYELINDRQVKHPMDAFLEGLAPTLKSFPPYYQHLAKGKIFAIVQELESQAFFSPDFKPSSPVGSSWNSTPIPSPQQCVIPSPAPSSLVDATINARTQ